MSDNGRRTFAQVLDREVDALIEARQTDGVAAPQPAAGSTGEARAHGAGFVGVALSGGGIRSATFNLGVLQALARGVLKRVDYLSCVSGGNYIGTWLAGLVRRGGGRVAKAEQVLANGEGAVREAPQVGFLRSYSNYLAPIAGMFSADTWTAIAVWTRNTFLNQLMLVSCLALLLLAPILATRVFRWEPEVFLARWLRSSGASEVPIALLNAIPFVLAIAVFVLLAIAVTGIARGLGYSRERRGHRGGTGAEAGSGAQGATATEAGDVAGLAQSAALWRVLLPGWLAACLLTWCLYHGTFDPLAPYFASLRRLPGPAGVGAWVVGGVAVYGLCWLLAWLRAAMRGNPQHADRMRRNLAWSLPSGAVLGLTLAIGAEWFPTVGMPHAKAAGQWLVSAIGPPLIALGAFSCTVAVHIGLAGRVLAEDDREWWARLGAWTMLLGLGWLAVFAIAILGPALVHWGRDWVAAAGGLWAVLSALGVWLAQGPATGGRDASRLKDLAATLAPYVFVVGLLIAVAVGVQGALTYGAETRAGEQRPGAAVARVVRRCETSVRQVLGEEQRTERCDTLAVPSFKGVVAQRAARIDQVGRSRVLLVALGALGVALLLAWRLDINLFAFHQFYRNRLTRAYLGATNADRKPDPFTGLDPLDDLPIADLGRDGAVQRPYHIANTTLNLTAGGEHLAWQQRKAAAFAFTPLHCGFEYPDAAQVSAGRSGCYVASERYMALTGHGPMLGSLMAVSGAAASPNCGYHTSATVAFLLAMFNVRLGRWCPHPQEAWNVVERESPRWGLAYLLRELFGAADEKSRYVYLSDGGHFENLGIYELARRRCRLIIACDAGQDAKFVFEDLGNAVRKCRIDLGVEIDIDPSPVVPAAGSRHSAQHFAIGTIRYPEDAADAEPGILVYIKASLTGAESGDLRAYAAAQAQFPHQSTIDQFFDEPQFESYRRLGYESASALVAPLAVPADAAVPADWLERALGEFGGLRAA